MKINIPFSFRYFIDTNSIVKIIIIFTVSNRILLLLK